MAWTCPECGATRSDEEERAICLVYALAAIDPGTPEPTECSSCRQRYTPQQPCSTGVGVTPAPAIAGLVAVDPVVTIHATFAPRWYADAQREAAVDGADARRREIVFAVCFAESYLFEWVRDEALRGNSHDLEEYFPPDQRRGVTEKWREVTKQLAADGVIPRCPNHQSAAWNNFNKLVVFRDGLVHARASRPQRDDTQKKALPVPTVQDLERMLAGEPTRVVVALVRELHASVGTPPPAWLSP